MEKKFEKEMRLNAINDTQVNILGEKTYSVIHKGWNFNDVIELYYFVI